ncbi:type II toxin-antitoxin system YafQ family toxin [Candidatus Uhrbacteria bacterium]|nr:type II toxin-antitoxin system YafQ family toxin [Candidatus Uhrbacteria bacterium]
MFILHRKRQFKKDFKRLSRNPEFDDGAFEDVLSCLLCGDHPSERYRPHKLTGEFHDCYECHVQPDILLIYIIDYKERIVYLLRLGSHAELFD